MRKDHLATACAGMNSEPAACNTWVFGTFVALHATGHSWTVLKTWTRKTLAVPACFCSEPIQLDGIRNTADRDIDDRLKRLSDLADQLETFQSAVDFGAQ